MNNRKLKKFLTAGTLYRVIGTDAVFMSLGGFRKGTNNIMSFNGMDIKKHKPVSRAEGRCRLATKKEQDAYWKTLRLITGNATGNFTVYHIGGGNQ